MKELSYEQIKTRELKMLDFIKQVCTENNLKYYLYAGTLVGAKIYQDFLPYDDDIDIVLSRPDYEKLLEILEKNSNKNYQLLTPYNDSNYYYPFAKLVDKKTLLDDNSRVKIKDLGLFIDIFPMDGLPNHFPKFYLFKMRLYKQLLLTKILTKPIIKRPRHLYYLLKYYLFAFINFLFRKSDNNYFALLVDKKAKRYDFFKAKFISLVNYGNRNSNYITREYFLKQDEYLFCGNYYTSVSNPDILLGSIYGKKIKHHTKNKHGFRVYLK